MLGTHNHEENTMKKPRIAAVVLPMRGDFILFGRKQGSPEIGEGTLNGPGGKMELIDKTIRHCAVRETLEELAITIDPANLEKIAIITFYAGDEPNMEVHFYRTEVWSGEPQETESMVPEWHHKEQIPYERFLAADRHFFPQLIQGEKFRTNVYYREKAKGYIKTDPFLTLDDLD